MSKEDVLCKCKNITKGDVKRALQAGVTSFRDVKRATGAGFKCGKCKAKIRKYIGKKKNQSLF